MGQQLNFGSQVLGFRDTLKQRRFSAEVVVVGTGAGGAAIGAELAEAGVDVLFVEEGSYHPTESFNPYLSESIPRLYRDGGTTVIYGKPSFPYSEGRCVGGTTVINGGMTWRTPEEVLNSWVEMTGDDTLSPAGLESYFERVEGVIHAGKQRPDSVGDDKPHHGAGRTQDGLEQQHQSAQSECLRRVQQLRAGLPYGGQAIDARQLHASRHACGERAALRSFASSA